MTKATIAYGSNTSPELAARAADLMTSILGEPVEVVQLPHITKLEQITRDYCIHRGWDPDGNGGAAIADDQGVRAAPAIWKVNAYPTRLALEKAKAYLSPAAAAEIDEILIEAQMHGVGE